VLPAEVAALFWEIDPSAIDLAAHRDYVLERIMGRGTLEAMRWLVRAYTRTQLADFLARRGDRLSPRDRAFWSLMAGSPIDAGPGGGRPPWAG
jgi:hypothetical protein